MYVSLKWLFFSPTLDQCVPNPCNNNGACNVTNGKVTCSCEDPFTGDRCEKGIKYVLNLYFSMSLLKAI